MKRRTIYWDSCVFIAWLYNERLEPGVMEGIEEMVRDVNAGRVVLFTSVMMKTEVLDSPLSPKAREMLSAVFKRSNVSLISQDERVADLSRDIRDHYAKPPRNIMLGSADCVHLATAILYKADVFVTLDGAGRKPRKDGLIPLSGDVMGHPLLIEKPHSQQPSLLTSLVEQRTDASAPRSTGVNRTEVSASFSPAGLAP
jgi:predicted nucleic acid-binding protein